MTDEHSCGSYLRKCDDILSSEVNYATKAFIRSIQMLIEEDPYKYPTGKQVYWIEHHHKIWRELTPLI